MERNQNSPLPGNSQTPVPLLYSGILFLLTVAFSVVPLFGFLSAVSKHHGTSSSPLFLGSLFLGGGVVAYCPRRYFEVHRWERGGRVYITLGVRFFGLLVPNGGGINRIVRPFQPDYRVVRSRGSIADLETRTRGAELFHMAILITILPSAIYAILLGWAAYGVMLTLPNIPLHVYPILLQRYTRARIERFSQHVYLRPSK